MKKIQARRRPGLGIVGIVGCISAATIGCDAFDQDTIDVELFNDSDQTVHMFVSGEVRSPANRLEPGQARIAQARFERSDTVVISVQNSLGLDLFGGCTFVDQEFDMENPFSGQVGYDPNSSDILNCSGNAFE
ncbi:MAG: hypothetical protein ACPGXK_01425 [Phycisphaerae bacterium]